MRINRTIFIFLVLWLVALTCTVAYNRLAFLVIPYAVFLINEVIYVMFGTDLFSSGSRTEIFYDLATLPTTRDDNDPNGTDPNYSEGYYPHDDYSISPREAENNKFAKILELLGAKSGDHILDVGCGTCTFGIYCKSKGIQVTGMTLSSEQVQMCAKEGGIYAIQWDYQKHNPNFDGVFNHIVWMGSSEHIWFGPHHIQSAYDKKKAAMSKLLKEFAKYFKPNVEGNIFFSGLHINPEFTKTPEAFLLDRTYGGQFTLNSKGYDIMSVGAASGYEVTYQRDSTKEYYMPTVLDRRHFGYPSQFTSKASLGLLTLSVFYPFAFYMWLYAVLGLWMWMFDGKLHIAAKPNFSLAKMEERPLTLWWAVLKHKNSTKVKRV